MTRAFVRLLALFALMLMPLSMGAVPASAQPAASSASGHCDDHQKPVNGPKDRQMHCTACTGLPAVEASLHVARMRPKAPMELTLVDVPPSVVPDTATPPPKLV